jgi:hypothetical protein
MIACIGWGSLIWDGRNLDVDGWRSDGPMLRVEFARQSRDGRIILVLVRDFAPLPTLWSIFNTRELAEARESLRVREGIPRSRAAESISQWRRGENPVSEPESTISAWATGKNLEAAVWTSLPPKFGGIDERVPTENEVLAYLGTLDGQALTDAEEYVRRAPTQITTAYRRTIEKVLGWTPVD